MPSAELISLCDQIEARKTDHFGKFYMYVSLLNTVSARNKSFADGLPKYDRGATFWRDRHLNIGGEIPIEFSAEVNRYVHQFTNVHTGWLSSLYNIALAYVRKGKISDLIHIIDKMLHHLQAIQGEPSHNKNIYSYINFEAKKEGISRFIEQISLFNQQLLAVVDSGINTALSISLIVTGLVLVLASVFSLIPSLIGLGLMIGGACGLYYFATQTKEQMGHLKEQMEQIKQDFTLLPQDKSLFDGKNHHAFFTSIVIPLPYAALTACEHVVPGEENQKKLAQERGRLDNLVSVFANL